MEPGEACSAVGVKQATRWEWLILLIGGILNFSAPMVRNAVVGSGPVSLPKDYFFFAGIPFVVGILVAAAGMCLNKRKCGWVRWGIENPAHCLVIAICPYLALGLISWLPVFMPILRIGWIALAATIAGGLLSVWSLKLFPAADR